jgi:homopolymeric O-antigen transport system permease protein
MQAPRRVRRERRSVVARRRFFLDHQLRDVVGVLFEQNVKIRYRGSALGIAWSALSPLGMAAVYAGIFGPTFSRYYEGSVLLYGAAVYIGLTLIGFFIAATTECSAVLVQNGGLLNKVRIPFEAFPLATVSAHAFQLLVGSLPLLVVLTLIMNHDPLRVLLLVVPFAALAMLAVGVGIFVSGAGVFFRDTPHLYELATFLLWVTSPVFYPAAIVPHRLAHFLVFNPLYSILQTARGIVLEPTLPPLWMFALALGEGALALVIGVAAFRAMRGRFMDHV